MKNGVIVCKSGHSLCQGCYDKYRTAPHRVHSLQTCPICRGALLTTVIVNIDMNSMMNSVTAEILQHLPFQEQEMVLFIPEGCNEFIEGMILRVDLLEERYDIMPFCFLNECGELWSGNHQNAWMEKNAAFWQSIPFSKMNQKMKSGLIEESWRQRIEISQKLFYWKHGWCDAMVLWDDEYYGQKYILVGFESIDTDENVTVRIVEWVKITCHSIFPASQEKVSLINALFPRSVPSSTPSSDEDPSPVLPPVFSSSSSVFFSPSHHTTLPAAIPSSSLSTPLLPSSSSSFVPVSSDDLMLLEEDG